MMSAPVTMLVLASALFSVMWSGDHPVKAVPHIIAGRAMRRNRQSVSTCSQQNVFRPGRLVESPGPGHSVEPAGVIRPTGSGVGGLDGPTDCAVDWRILLFQKMAASGRPAETVWDEITNVSESARVLIGDRSRGIVRRWMTATRSAMEQSCNRFQQARKVVLRTPRTAHL